jgi:hypothetical protein
MSIFTIAAEKNYVGCNKRSALHRMAASKSFGAMPVGYCALRQFISPRPLAGVPKAGNPLGAEAPAELTQGQGRG